MKTKRSITTMAEEILQKKGKPLHYKEITALLSIECKLTGKTPHETIRSRLATNPKFKRVAEGVFALSIWTEYPSIRFAKDIAYDILKDENKPIELTKLGQRIFTERKFITSPVMIARGVANTDKRFYYDKSTGLVSLTEWEK